MRVSSDHLVAELCPSPGERGQVNSLALGLFTFRYSYDSWRVQCVLAFCTHINQSALERYDKEERGRREGRREEGRPLEVLANGYRSAIAAALATGLGKR